MISLASTHQVMQKKNTALKFALFSDMNFCATNTVYETQSRRSSIKTNHGILAAKRQFGCHCWSGREFISNGTKL